MRRVWPAVSQFGRIVRLTVPQPTNKLSYNPLMLQAIPRVIGHCEIVSARFYLAARAEKREYSRQSLVMGIPVAERSDENDRAHRRALHGAPRFRLGSCRAIPDEAGEGRRAV